MVSPIKHTQRRELRGNPPETYVAYVAHLFGVVTRSPKEAKMTRQNDSEMDLNPHTGA